MRCLMLRRALRFSRRASDLALLSRPRLILAITTDIEQGVLSTCRETGMAVASRKAKSNF
jgi:hypothetical protein